MKGQKSLPGQLGAHKQRRANAGGFPLALTLIGWPARWLAKVIGVDHDVPAALSQPRRRSRGPGIQYWR